MGLSAYPARAAGVGRVDLIGTGQAPRADRRLSPRGRAIGARGASPQAGGGDAAPPRRAARAATAFAPRSRTAVISGAESGGADPPKLADRAEEGSEPDQPGVRHHRTPRWSGRQYAAIALAGVLSAWVMRV